MSERRKVQPGDRAHVHHARERAAERWGVAFGARENRAAVRQIRAGQAVHLRTGWHDQREPQQQHQVYRVNVNGRQLPVVYSPRHGLVTSVLPEAELERAAQRERRGQIRVVDRPVVHLERPLSRSERRKAEQALRAGLEQDQAERLLGLPEGALAALRREVA